MHAYVTNQPFNDIGFGLWLDCCRFEYIPRFFRPIFTKYHCYVTLLYFQSLNTFDSSEFSYPSVINSAGMRVGFSFTHQPNGFVCGSPFGMVCCPSIHSCMISLVGLLAVPSSTTVLEGYFHRCYCVACQRTLLVAEVVGHALA
jgi:hypothetical protein